MLSGHPLLASQQRQAAQHRHRHQVIAGSQAGAGGGDQQRADQRRKSAKYRHRHVIADRHAAGARAHRKQIGHDRGYRGEVNRLEQRHPADQHDQRGGRGVIHHQLKGRVDGDNQ